MMKAVARGLVTLAALAESCRWAMQLAGPPSTDADSDEDSLCSVSGLRLETRNRLPESMYHVFEQGVQFQLDGQPDHARAAYDKLRHWPLRGGGTFDLSKECRGLRKNLRLLDNL